MNDKICALFGSEDVRIDDIFLGWNSTQILVSRNYNLLKQTSQQNETIECDDDIELNGSGKKTLMGFVNSDSALMFGNEMDDDDDDEILDGMEGRVTLMGPVTQ